MDNKKLADVSVSEPLPALCEGQYLGYTEDPNDICYPCNQKYKWALYYEYGVQCAMCPDGENVIDDNYIYTTLCTIPS